MRHLIIPLVELWLEPQLCKFDTYVQFRSRSSVSSLHLAANQVVGMSVRTCVGDCSFTVHTIALVACFSPLMISSKSGILRLLCVCVAGLSPCLLPVVVELYKCMRTTYTIIICMYMYMYT